MITVCVLGPIEVAVDGHSIRVPAGKPSELLVRLALDAGMLVRTERIIDDLWGPEADSTERNTVQSKVSMLRRALGDAVTVSGARAGYTLEVGADAVDALNVGAMHDHAQDRLAAGEASAALEAASEALSRFRGEVLPDAGDGDWLVPHRARLEEMRLGLTELKITARMELGASADVLGELEELVLLHPLREGLWARLITALYREHRQADALAAYRRIHDILDDELGLSPGPELQELEQRVLRQDAALEGPDRVARQVSPAPHAGNLPRLTSALVGRDAELRSIASLMERHHLVTIVGPAGVGKTRTAIDAARAVEQPDGAWLVRLDQATSPDVLPQLVGEALGVTGATDPVVLDRLRSMQALLVLDNCEHMVDAVADFALRILDVAPSVRILATSQLPLDLDGEVIFALDPLPIGASVELFTQRAAERRPSFALDPDGLTAIEELCMALDGLPLAIELAAARTKVLSVQEIARRLDDRFSLLSDPTSRRTERHRALSTAIAWSYDLLFPDEQRVLWAMACFTGGAPLPAVEFIGADLGVPSSSAVDAIGRLADRSLVAVDIGDAGAVRYRLLDSVRAFAADRLTDAGLSDAARTAHAEWFALQADRAHADQQGPRAGPHLAFVRLERANIDAALEWTAIHDPAQGIRIAVGFGWSSTVHGEGGVATNRLRRVLEAADGVVSPGDRAIALTLITWNEGGADVQQACVDGESAVQTADESGVPAAVATSRFALAFAFMHAGRALESAEIVDAWRRDHAAAATPWELGMSCMMSGYAGLALGDQGRVRKASEEGAQLIDVVGDDWLTSHIESITGQLAQTGGDLDAAILHLRRAADAAHRLGLLAAEGFHLISLGRAQQLAGDARGAATTVEQAIETAQTVGLMRVVALAQVRLGRLLLDLGEDDGAYAVLRAADTWFRASGGGDDAAVAECLLATLEARGSAPGSQARLDLLLVAARSSGEVDVQIMCLDALAALHATAGDFAPAGGLLREADELMPRAAHRLAEIDRLDAARARELIAASPA